MRYFTCLKHARAIEGFRGCNFNVFRTVLSSDGQPPSAAGAGHPPHHRWAFRADPHPIIAGFGRDVVGYAVDNGDPDHDAARDVGEHKRSTRHHASIDPHAERGATAVAPCIGQATSASIHAPARGATTHSTPSPRRRGRFNPRAREGRDIATKRASRSGVAFQSTRPRGARQSNRSDNRFLFKFQSTRPRGARPSAARYSAALHFLFQSTRPRGARPSIWPFLKLFLMFQSTRPRGARPQEGDRRAPQGRVSIHAPARGAT